MTKILSLFLIASVLIFTSSKYNGSTTASVTLSGGIIKAQHVENNKKFKRKDCPVCKGKGWYISGDGISKVDCGYCEPNQEAIKSTISNNENCVSGSCSLRKK